MSFVDNFYNICVEVQKCQDVSSSSFRISRIYNTNGLAMVIKAFDGFVIL